MLVQFIRLTAINRVLKRLQVHLVYYSVVRSIVAENVATIAATSPTDLVLQNATYSHQPSLKIHVKRETAVKCVVHRPAI